MVIILRINSFFSSIRWKLVLTYLIIIVIAFSVINISVTRIVEEFLINQRIKVQQKATDHLAIQVAPYLENAEADHMLQVAISSGQELGGRVLILNHDGVVQVDGFSELNGVKLDYREVRDITSGIKDRSYGFHLLKNGNGTYPAPVNVWPDGSSGTWVVYYTSVITYNARRIGVLVLSVSIQDVVNTKEEISARLTIYSFIVSMLVVFLSFIISGLITKPVIELTQVIRQMSSGRFNQRVKVSGRNEFSQLAIAFNTMSERLENLDKARNEFVSNASHELKTPLSSMKVLIESLILQDMGVPEIYKEFLQDINSEIDRLTAIINDLLSLVQIDQQEMVLKKEHVPLGDLVSKCIRSLVPLAKNKSIELELIIRDNLTVQGDPLKLHQVVYNLVDNGIKYTPDQGTVRVELYKRGRLAVIEIADTGIGIPEKDLIHIFERFYRVDKARSRATGGTGLGLSIVHQIVLLHGGDIQVSSEEGVGTTFYVELPLAL